MISLICHESILVSKNNFFFNSSSAAQHHNHLALTPLLSIFGDYWRVRKVPHVCIVTKEKDYGFVEDLYLFLFLISDLLVHWHRCIAMTGDAILVSLSFIGFFG